MFSLDCGVTFRHCFFGGLPFLVLHLVPFLGLSSKSKISIEAPPECNLCGNKNVQTCSKELCLPDVRVHSLEKGFAEIFLAETMAKIGIFWSTENIRINNEQQH